jgi:hypothetical protein
MARLIERPPIHHWLITTSFWVVVVLGLAIVVLIYTGNKGWAAPLTIFMGWALARWGIRLAAYIHPIWFNPLWLNRQGWTRVEPDLKP